MTKSLALFDFDGTITFGDTFTPFIKYTCSKPRLLMGMILLSPFILLYKTKLLPATVMRPLLVKFALWRRDKEQISALAKTFFAHSIVPQLRPSALEQLSWHKAQNHTIVIVSANVDILLTNWCKTNGYELIASELAVSHTRLTGGYSSPECSGEQKANQVKAKHTLADYQTIYAYGDTQEALAMLALADVKYLNGQRLK